MFEYFWTYKTDLPADVGTPNFSPMHLGCLAAAVLLIVAMIFIYRRQNEPVRKRIQRVLIVLAAVLEVSRWIWAAVIGHGCLLTGLPKAKVGDDRVDFFAHLCSVISRKLIDVGPGIHHYIID